MFKKIICIELRFWKTLWIRQTRKLKIKGEDIFNEHSEQVVNEKHILVECQKTWKL